MAFNMNKSINPSELASTSTVSTRQSMEQYNPAIIDMPARGSKREIPHSSEYGDTYHIGTCYDEDTEHDWDLPAS